MPLDKPITIQHQDPDTEQWTDYFACHAKINKIGGSEYVNAGSERSRASLTFEIRHSAVTDVLRYNTQIFRILYRGNIFNIVDTDLYMEDKRNNLRLVGEFYGTYTN